MVQAGSPRGSRGLRADRGSLRAAGVPPPALCDCPTARRSKTSHVPSSPEFTRGSRISSGRDASFPELLAAVRETVQELTMGAPEIFLEDWEEETEGAGEGNSSMRLTELPRDTTRDHTPAVLARPELRGDRQSSRPGSQRDRPGTSAGESTLPLANGKKTRARDNLVTDSCDRMRPHLHDYVEGELGTTLARRVCEHLKRCATCSVHARSWSDDLHLLFDPPRAEVRRDFASSVIRELKRNRRRQRIGHRPQLRLFVSPRVPLPAADCLWSLQVAGVIGEPREPDHPATLRSRCPHPAGTRAPSWKRHGTIRSPDDLGRSMLPST